MERLFAWQRSRPRVRLFLTWSVLAGGGLAAALGDRPLFRLAGVVLAVWGGFNTGLIVAERERAERRAE